MNGQDLKNSILQMTMQGKLVEQRPEDGTGEDLYQQIQEEKQKLIAEGKLKKEKPLQEINKEEIPFEIPNSWKWVKFGNLTNYYMGKTPPRAESEWWSADFPWVSIADMPDNGHILKTKESVSELAINDVFKNRISPKGTLLMSFKLTVGRVSILDVDAVHNEAIISINTYHDDKSFILKYLFYVLPKITNYGDSKDAIKGKTLNKTSINNLLIPLPPYNEIGRIVYKLKTVLPLIEEYGKLEGEREDLDVELPEKLKKSILQYAMQGKLVPQIPSEGTAEELYVQIQEEKQKLISEGKLKKEKPLPPITEDEIPFQIPPTWKWVRVADVFALINGDRGKNYPSKDKLSNSGIPFISAINLDGEKVVVDDSLKYMTHKQYDKLNSGKLNNNDVIVCIRGSLGKHAVFHLGKGAIASSLVILRLMHNQETLIKWMLLYLDSLVFNDEIKKYDNGTAQPNLSASNFKKFLFPVPCLNEQKRIIKKINDVLTKLSS